MAGQTTAIILTILIVAFLMIISFVAGKKFDYMNKNFLIVDTVSLIIVGMVLLTASSFCIIGTLIETTEDYKKLEVIESTEELPRKECNAKGE